MKRSEKVAVVFICTTLFLLFGCSPTVETVERTTSQEKLAKIAIKTTNMDVFRVAVERLNDQTLLRKVLVSIEGRWVVKYGSLAMLYDFDEGRLIVLDKITDEPLLRRIAREHQHWESRCAAYRQLNKINSSISTGKQGERLNNDLFIKLDNVFKQIPAYGYRQRCGVVFEIVEALTDPLVYEELGSIDDIKISWDHCVSTIGEYTGVVQLQGDIVNMSIKMDKMDKEISYRWVSHFPATLEVGRGIDRPYIPAELFAEDFLAYSFRHLSDFALAEIATSGQSSLLRQSAVCNLNDLVLLAKIVAEDRDEIVRQAAKQKIAIIGK